MPQIIQETGNSLAIFIIVIETMVLAILVLGGLYYFKFRHKTRTESTPSIPPALPIHSLDELAALSAQRDESTPLNVSLGDGEYKTDRCTAINKPFRLFGAGAVSTKIIATNEQPALRIENAKNCLVSNVRIEGAIHCTRAELTLENCHIVANQQGICIEADEGSIVTFSGLMRGEGGIAIRARGESQVILKPPYAISGEDYVVIDPKSEIQFGKNHLHPNPPMEQA
ncbi:MAG: hypothetical protein RBU29_13695 [bacterium]|nr:hypothetical protein [bacterium]